MKKTVCTAFFVLLLTAAWAQTPEEILARSDDSRTIPDMGFEVKLTNFENSQLSDEATLVGALKLGGDHNRVLLAFTAPASSRGQKLLVDGDAVYLLFVRTTNPIRLSPLEVLTGQASNGDVVRTFAQDYDVKAMTREDREGTPSEHFSLVAKEKGNTSSYKTVQLWVEAKTLHLQYAEFYAASGVLLKKAFYRDYREALGKDFPFTVDIQAGDDPQKHTTMTFGKIAKVKLPETVFRRSFLNAWTPEVPK
jgi:hypothetical protein